MDFLAGPEGDFAYIYPKSRSGENMQVVSLLECISADRGELI